MQSSNSSLESSHVGASFAYNAQSDQIMECSVKVINEITIQEKPEEEIRHPITSAEQINKIQTTDHLENKIETDSGGSCVSYQKSETTLEESTEIEINSTSQDHLIHANATPISHVPTIPSIFKYLSPSTEARAFSPISLESKSEEVTEEDNLGLGKPQKPEFNFAFGNVATRRNENVYSESTALSLRTIQSETFESQGHYNARSRSTSPFPVYVPKERGIVQEREPEKPNECKQPTTKILIEKMDPKNPEHEEHIKNLVMSTSQEKSESLLMHKGCFNELEEIKVAYNIADDLIDENINQSMENNTMDTIHANYQFVGSNSNGDVALQTHTETSSEKVTVNTKEVQAPTTFDKVEQDSRKSPSKGSSHEQDSIKASPKELSPEHSDRPRFKKAPDAVIGARPLFGPLDLNSEFQKAIINRQKSIKSKRTRSAGDVKINANIEPKIKTEKTEIETHLEVTENTKLATDFKKTEIAQVEKVFCSDTDEIEKVYYQQEREINIDFQRICEENAPPPHIEFAIQQDQYVYDQMQKRAFHEGSMGMEPYSSDSVVSPEEDDYVKVPVRSLIRCFEESTMPTMKYKQLREPLPDVVEKLGTLQNTTKMTSEKQSVMQCEYSNNLTNENSDTFYVSQTQVETRYLSPDHTKMQSIVPSENSSFCRYVSPTSHAEITSSCCEMQSANSLINTEHQMNGKLFCFG